MFPILITAADKVIRFKYLYQAVNSNKIDKIVFQAAMDILFTSREEFDSIMKEYYNDAH